MKLLNLALSFVMVNVLSAQYCDSITPSFLADLSGTSDAFWISPDTARIGNCCGTSNPDNCVEFELLLHPESQGIVFDIHSGAVPPGALFYQIDCGPIVEVGQPICLDGAGPHHLTFCKPGNNSNAYSIQSIPAPSFSPDIVINDGCFGLLGIANVDESTVTWNSIYPGNQGDYNNYLSCQAGCDTVEVSAQAGYPPYVDYMVCGMPLNECDTLLSCHTMRVTFHSTLQVEIFPENPVICFGSSEIELTAVASGGTPPYQLQWNTLETDTSILANAGFYSVQLSDASGCPPTNDTVTVIQYAVPIVVDANTDINICESDIPVQLGGNITGASGGVWTGGAGVYNLSNTDLAATYTPSNLELQNGVTQLFLTSTGNHGCPAITDTININYRTITTDINLQTTNVSCNTFNDGVAGVAINGADAPYDIVWDNGENGSQIANLTANDYSVSITNTYGCDTLLNYTITEPAPLSIQVNSQNISCFNESDGEVAITANGGTPLYQLSWGNASTPYFFAGNSINIDALPSGLYSFVVEDANECQIVSDVNITQPAPLNLALLAEDSLCIGEFQNATALVNGGTAPYDFNWSIGVVGAFAISFIQDESGYTGVSVSDQNGCTIEDSVYTLVQQLYRDSLNLFASGDICIGEEVTISSFYSGVSEDVIYQWEPCVCPGSGPFTLEPVVSTNYVLTVSDYCNNKITDSVQINVNPLPVVNLPIELARGCAPLSVDLPVDSGLADMTLTWSYGDGSPSGSSSYHVYDDPGNYYVTLNAVNQFGCEANSIESHTVLAFESPEAGIWTDKKTVDMNYPVVIFKSQSIGAKTYNWDFGDGNFANTYSKKHEYQTTGRYKVTHWVENEYGCVDTANTEIKVNPTVSVFVPNAFTPDGDGVNDEFFLKGSGLVDEDFEMNIYNRWGELIFTSYQLDVKWNGEVKGLAEIAQSEVYVYSISVKDIFRETHELYGHVALLK